MSRRPLASLAVVALVWAAVGPPSAAASVLEPTVRTLPNGLRVAVFRDARLPLVTVQLTVPAGSAAERPGESGAAHLVAELVRRGTTSRDARVFAADVERLGGSITTSSGRDFAAVSGQFLARDLASAVELVADAVTHPVFLDGELEPLRTATGRAIAQQLSNPSAAVEDGVWAMGFGASGYGRPPLGTIQGVSGATSGALRDFHARLWRPETAVLAIAGDVDLDRAVAAAEEWFGPWHPVGAAPPPAPTPPPPTGRIRIIDRGDLDEVEIRVAVVGPRRGDVDDVPLRVLGRVLAGSATARLDRARAEGAAARSPRAAFVPLRDGGLFQIGVSAAPESAGAAVRAALDALRALESSPPTEAELGPARAGVRGAYALQLETLGQVVSQWSGGALYGLPPDELGRMPARTDSVDAPRAASAARRWLVSDRANVVVIGPAEVLKPQLASLGDVQVVALQDLAAAPDRPAPAPRPEFTADQQKRARDLVKRALQAHGGRAKVEGIRSSVMTADVTLQVDRREVAGTVQQTRKDPYRMLYVTALEGISMRQVLAGERGWSVDPSSGAVIDADSLQLRALRNGFESDVPHLLLDASRANASIGLTGTASLDGRDVETVEVRSPSGARRLLHFDKTTHRLVAMDQNEGGTQSFGSRRVYRDYRPTSGVLLPFEEDRLLDGQRVMQLKVTRIELNPPIDDAPFARPEEPLPPPSR